MINPITEEIGQSSDICVGKLVPISEVSVALAELGSDRGYMRSPSGPFGRYCDGACCVTFFIGTNTCFRRQENRLLVELHQFSTIS